MITTDLIIIITATMIFSILFTIVMVFVVKIMKDKKFNITIVCYEKTSNGYKSVLWNGYKAEIKQQATVGDSITIKKSYKMIIDGKSGNYSFPDDKCFVSTRKGFFGGKLVSCTYINGQITWLNPNIDFSQFSAFDSNESQLALQNLKTGYERWKFNQEKPVDLMTVMPYIILLIILVVGVWLSFNQYAYMKGNTDEFFTKMYTFYTTLMNSVSSAGSNINQTIHNSPII